MKKKELIVNDDLIKMNNEKFGLSFASFWQLYNQFQNSFSCMYIERVENTKK